MTQSKRNKLKIVCATSVAIFSLATCFSGVFAWFTNKINGNVVNEDIAIVNRNNAMVSDSVVVYEYDFVNETPHIAENMSLHGYDCFIEERNVYNRKYIQLDLSFPNGIPSNSSLEIIINAPTTNYYEDSSKQKVARFISNMVQFKYFDNKNRVIDTTKDAKTIYNRCKDVFSGITAYDTFVDDKIAGTKSVIDNKNSIYLPEVPYGTIYETQIIIEYDYNQSLINYFKEKSGIDFDVSFFKDITSIEFASDISEISFDIAKS